MCFDVREEDYERTFGGKTIAAGLTVRFTPTADVGALPDIEISDEVEDILDRDEVSCVLCCAVLCGIVLYCDVLSVLWISAGGVF